MVVTLAAFTLLFCGFVFYGRKLDKNFGVSIHRMGGEVQKGADADPLTYRSAQLALLGLISGIECLYSAVIGVLYGPLMMVWCVVGGTFLSGALTYYCGMYAVSHEGKTPNYAVKERFGWPLYIFSTFVLLTLLVLGVCLYLSFLQMVNYYTYGLPKMWYIYLLLIALVGYSPQSWLNGIYMTIAVVFLFSLFLLFVRTAVYIPSFSFAWNMEAYPQIKYAYPVLMFTVSAVAASGFSCLSGCLVAPSVRNEKMGRGIFFGMSLMKAGLVILLALMIQAAYPDNIGLNSQISRAVTPYTVLHRIVQTYLGQTGGILFYTLAVMMCAGSGGALLRIGRKIFSESGLLKGNTELLSVVILLAACAVYYIRRPNFDFVAAASSLTMLLLWGYCAVYLRNSGKNCRMVLFPLFIMGGAFCAYVLLLFAGQPLKDCVVLGISFSVLLFIIRYFYNGINRKSR